MMSAKDAVEQFDASRGLDKRTDYTLLKLTEDQKIKELLFEKYPQFAPMWPLFTPLNALTYLPGDNQVESRKAYVGAAILIESCFVDERDSAAITLLHSLELFGGTQAFDSRKGFKTRTVTENKLNIEQSAAPPVEKKKFLGVF